MNQAKITSILFNLCLCFRFHRSVFQIAQWFLSSRFHDSGSGMKISRKVHGSAASAVSPANRCRMPPCDARPMLSSSVGRRVVRVAWCEWGHTVSGFSLSVSEKQHSETTVRIGDRAIVPVTRPRENCNLMGLNADFLAGHQQVAGRGQILLFAALPLDPCQTVG